MKKNKHIAEKRTEMTQKYQTNAGRGQLLLKRQA